MIRLNIFLTSLLLLVSVKTSKEIILESTKSPEPWFSDCMKINFNPEYYITCFCLQGIYAFKTSEVGDQVSHWKVIGAHEESCHRLGDWVSEIQLLAETTEESLIRQLVARSNFFVVTNIEDWQVKTVDVNLQERTYCLTGAPNRNSYCSYNIKAPVHLSEGHFQKGCEAESEILDAVECHEFILPKIRNDEGSTIEPIQCSLAKPKHETPRFKRDMAAPNDTDFNEPTEVTPDPADTTSVQGNADMMASISKYVKNKVKELIEQSDPSKPVAPVASSKIKYPPGQTLLRLCTKVAQKICSPVPEDTFSIILEAFLTQQTSFQQRDTYVSFPSYDRILQSMNDCEGQAGSFIFAQNESTACPSQLPNEVSEIIIRNGVNVSIPVLPDWGVAKTDMFEPVVEVMWKTFLMAHSYCFKFFKRYFNDHHTFTATMIPFFTNQIQDIWLVVPPDPSAGAGAGADAVPVNYTSGTVWYGNLLGPAGDLFKNVDHCYRASRIPAGTKMSSTWKYPWFIRRPPRDFKNEWVYKTKRSVAEEPIQERCLVNTD